MNVWWILSEHFRGKETAAMHKTSHAHAHNVERRTQVTWLQVLNSSDQHLDVSPPAVHAVPWHSVSMPHIFLTMLSKPTPWSNVLLRSWSSFSLSRKPQTFMEPEGPLPWRKEPATRHYPDKSSSHTITIIYLRSILIIFSFLHVLRL